MRQLLNYNWRKTGEYPKKGDYLYFLPKDAFYKLTIGQFHLPVGKNDWIAAPEINMEAKNLVLLIGISGAGKSAFANRNFTNLNSIIISTDKLRGVIGENEGDQSVSRKVFETAEFFLDYLLKFCYHGDIVVDATNYRPKNRKNFVKIGRRNGAYIKAICFDMDIETCKKRNLNRDRKVPEHIIERQFKNLSFPDIGEVDEITYIRDYD